MVASQERDDKHPYIRVLIQNPQARYYGNHALILREKSYLGHTLHRCA